MNRHLYRLVFNRSRNKLMAVQETASSVSGGSGGETASKTSSKTSSKGPAAHGSAALHCIARAVLLALGASLLQPMASAQTKPSAASSLPITPASTAPAGQRPVIDAAQNGVPIVHIAPPSAAGVSVNKFKDFNVNANGLIENNSAASVQTQTGGWIAGNPQLGHVPARIIVNQVVGTNQSVLKGAIEVAGRSADVVISNPNGLVVDGLGFINTSRAMLTTGAPQYTGRGGLEGVSVTRGSIEVGGGGLNASRLEQLDLIARGFVIEGEVWAQALNLLAGANRVPYASLGSTPSITAQGGTGTAPRFAVEIRDLGALYAHGIYLVATEQGLGVNSTGRIAALQGNIKLSANGDLTLKDTYATQGVTLNSAANIALTGQTQTALPTGGSAAGDVAIVAAGALTNTGTVDAAAGMVASAASLDNAGTLVQRGHAAPMALNLTGEAKNSGAIYSAAALQLDAKTFSDSNGTLQSAGALSINAQSLALNGTQLSTDAALALHANQGDLSSTHARLIAGDSVTLQASGQLVQAGGLLQSRQNIALQAASITNRDATVLAHGALDVATPGVLDNTGGKLMGSASATIAAGSLINDASAANAALIASDFATQIATHGTLSNQGGVISGKTDLAIDTHGSALNNATGTLVSDSGLSLRTGDLESRAGQIVARGASGGSLAIVAAHLGNDGGTISSAATLAVDAQALSNRGGVITSGAGTALSTQAIDNSAGTLSSAAAIALDTHAQALVNTGGAITATGAVDVKAGTVSNGQGRVMSGTDHVSITAADLDNTTGVISAITTASVQASGAVVNDHGDIASAGSVRIAAGQALSNRSGRVAATNAVTLTASALDNTQGAITANQTGIELAAGTLTNDGGQLVGSGTTAGSLLLHAGQIDNRGGMLATGAALAIDTQGRDLDNTGGTLQAGQALTIAAANLRNAGGRLTGFGDTRIATTGAIDNTSGEISAARAAVGSGSVSIASAGQSLVNDAGRIVAEGGLQLSAGAVSNVQGTVSAATDATLTVASLVNSGMVQAGNDLQLGAAGAVTNTGRLAAGRDAAITAGGVASVGSSVSGAAPASITAGRDLGLSAASLANERSFVQAGRSLSVAADAVGNHAGGELLAGAGLQVAGLTGAAARIDNSQGLISAQGTAQLAASTLNNDAGRIASTTAGTSITAGATSNRAGLITSSIGTVLVAGSLDNRAGEVSSGGALSVNTQGEALNNQGGRLVATSGLALSTGALDNTAAGQIGSTAGNLALTAASLANDAGRIAAGQSITAQLAGSLSNHGGKIVADQALSLNLTSAAAALDNTGGALIANHGGLDATASRIANAGGLVSGATAVTLLAGTQALDNAGGQILSDGSVSLQATGLSNSAGTVSSANTRIELGTGSLDNTAGKLIGSTTLQLGHGSLTNRQGQIVTHGDLAIDTHGQALDNTAGDITADGALSFTTGTLANQRGTLYSGSALQVTSQALDNTQGRIVATSRLDLHAGAVDNTAGTLATTSPSGQAALDVASLVNTDGTLSTGTLQLLSAGDVTNAGGSIGATQDARITAQRIVNLASATQRSAGSQVTGQIMAGGDLVLNSAGELVNSTALIQSGRSATLQAGSLTNDAGVIDSHGTLSASITGAASNRAGTIRTANPAGGAATAGRIAFNAASLDNTSGTVNAATALALTTGGALVNASGLLQASGGTLGLNTAQLDNRAGAIVGAADIQASTSALDNTGGTVSAKTDLGLDTRGGALVNRADGVRDATLVAGGTATIQAGALINANQGSARATLAAQNLSVVASQVTNTGTLAAGGANGAEGTLAVVAAGDFINDAGAVQAVGSLSLQAQRLSNQGGKVVSTRGAAAGAPSLTITTAGSLNNANAGLIAAFDGDATLNTQGAGLANAQGGTVYAGRVLTLKTGAIDNTASGSLQAAGALNATTRALDNTGGLVRGAQVTVDTQGQAFTNAAGGAVESLGDATLSTGALANRGSTIVAGGRLAMTAMGAVDNTGGTLSGMQGLALAASGHNVTNTGGIAKSALGDLTITAASLVNDGAVIASAGTTRIEATTSVSNRSAVIGGASVQGQITGRDLSLTTGTLDNTGGRIAADHDATLATASTNNTSGVISALHDLTLTATALANTNGQIVANNALTLTTASASFGGLLAGYDLTLNVQGDYLNTGALSARHDLTVNASNLVNSGLLGAGNTLAVNAQGNITNTASGELSGANVELTATGQINNQGLVNSTAAGGHARLLAAQLTNQGRLYGDEIGVQAAQITNSGTGVIAARGNLNLAGQTIANVGADALLFSLGGLNVGANLDPVNGVSGNANSFTNTAGRVEASGDMSLSANTISNANGGLQTQLVITAVAPQTTYVIPVNSAKQYPLSQCRGISEGSDQAFCILHPEVYGQRSTLAAVWDTSSSFGTAPHYAWNDPVYRQLNVASPSTPRPVEPGGVGACTPPGDSGAEGGSSSVPGPQCDQWHVDAAAWDNAYLPIGYTLQAAINTYNAGVNRDNATLDFEDYTVLKVTATTQQTQLTASAPGQILAGGNMVLNGTSITNTDSRIVAGGLLYVNGQANTSGSQPVTAGVRNIATPGQQVTSYSGTSMFSHLDNECGFLGTSCHHKRNDDYPNPYNPAATPTTFDLPTVVYQQNAAQLQGGIAQASATGANATTATAAGAIGASAVAGSVAPTGPNPQTITTAGASAAASQTQTGTTVAAPATGSTGPAPTAANGSTAAGAISTTNPQPTLVAYGSATATAGAVAPAASAGIPTVQRYALNGSDQRARDVILTVVPGLKLPTNQLFKVDPAPGAKYLVETDPRFTNYQTFLGSDYFQQQLQLDPSRLAKRYGDGFEEQRLIDDQVLALTGRRYLSGYSSTEAEYLGLMNAGVAFAQAYQLTPGMSLSAEQMALLTTDIVWLTTQTVTLADGSTTQALIPQVYLRQVRGQGQEQGQGSDLAPSGALMAGGTLIVKTPGQLVNSASLGADSLAVDAADITNSGSITAQRSAYLRASNDLTSTGAIMAGAGTGTGSGTISLTAGRDIVLQTRTLDSFDSTTTANGSSLSSRTNVDRIATVQAGGELLINAGRDLDVQGASLSAGGELQATAGRDIRISAVQGSYQIDVKTLGGASTQGRTGYISQAATTQQAASLSAGSHLALVAGGDADLTGANLNAGKNALIQGANVNIAAALESQRADVQTVQKNAYDRGAESQQTLVGGKVSAGGNLTVNATTGNVTLAGAQLSAASGQTSLIASGDVKIGALGTESSRLSESYYQHSGGIANVYTSSEQRQSERSSQTSQLQGSSVSGNTVLVQAGRNGQQDGAKQTGDITLQASTITAQGAATLSAGRDVLIDAGQQSTRQSEFEQSSKSFAIGPKVLERAAQQISKDLLQLDPIAKKYLPPPSASGTQTEVGDAGVTSSQSIGSSISADSLSISSGRDTLVRGSAIVTTGDLGITAGRNLDIITSQDQQSSAQSRTENNKGLFNSGAGLTTGTREVAQTGSNTSSTATSSQVASLGGNVSLQAGEAYKQTGSQVLALGQNSAQSATGGDISIQAKTVDIGAARTTTSDQQSTHFKQEGVTVSLSSPIITALQSIQQASDSAGKTDDPRFKALAAATAAMAAYDAAKALSAAAGTGNPASVGISVDLGHSQSQSQSSQTSDLASGSTINAARNLSIIAAGAGRGADGKSEGKSGSNITVTGSDLKAGNTATLKAEGEVTLQAASNTATLQSKDSSQSASVGMTFGGGSQNGLSFHAAVSAARGSANGADLFTTNSHLSAGNTALIQSGGDTTLNGATVQANTVKADIGGNLKIASLQDTSSFSSQSKTAGAGVSVCIPPICYGEVVSVSASLSAAKVNGDFKSVAEQSGIKAADGGFQIKVGGNTDLKGAVITSSQSAVEQNKNSLATATLTTSELQNKDQYSASGFSVSYGSSGGGSAGLGMSSGDQRSTTKSGISAGTIKITDEPAQKALTGQDAATTLASLNTQVTTDKDTSGAIKKQWDGQKLQQEVQAQAQITAAFGSAAAKEVGDYAASKTQPIIDANNYLALKDAQNNGTLSEAGQARLTQMETQSGYTPEKAQATLKDPQAQQDYDNWKEGGAYRVAAHTVVGAMAGGVSGALGAGASAAAAPTLNDLQYDLQASLAKAGLGQDAAKAVSKLVGSAAATAVGTVASGGSVVGAAAAANEDLNNRQLTHNEADRIKKLANGDAQKEARLTAAACAMAQCAAGVPTDDPSYAFLKGLQDAGASMTTERALLGQQTGQVGRATQGLFTYDPIVDTAGDYLGQNKMGTRLAGAVQGGAGIAGVAGSSALCTTGVGCLAGAVGATVSADYAQAGVRQAFTGDAKVTQGEQVLQSLGLSPQAAAITYAAIGLAPAAVEAAGKIAASTLDRAATDTLVKTGGAIDKNTGLPMLDMKQLTTSQKEVVGELFGSNTVKQIVPDGTKIGRTPGPGQSGIDDLFQVSRPDVDYVVIEYKFDTSKQGTTLDGKQMSDSWLRGDNTRYDRILESVGNDPVKADQIATAMRNDRIEKWVVRTKPDGSTEIKVLDSNGNFKNAAPSTILNREEPALGAKP